MLDVTHLHGSRRAIGLAHGQRHAAQIRRSIAVYDRLFQDFVGLDWAAAKREAQRFVPAIERGFAAILDELAGIAQGAGLERDDILTLNCRSEISLTQASGGCSAFSLHQHGHQWLAQNWDWRADQLDNVVILRIEGDDAPPLVSVGEAGMVAKIGLNAHGLGVCLNAIRSQTCGDGLPIHFALRKILESDGFASARRIIEEDRVASPAHFLVASADGQAAGFEVQPGPPGVLEPSEGRVTHTNHLYAEAATACVADFPKPDSHVRLRRLDELLDPPPAASVGALFEVLSDHHNAPMAICKHTDPGMPEAERMETLFAVVMTLDERTLHLRHGYPCEAEETLSVSLA
ncbi:C45 family autoproteolytic acyltransferase/hydolase [Halomonas salipaludis]|uniref:Peptidase C45 acyl-coenzyme A--6-aminopenicillanic acid acyl-transferase n=1 Tax=Halomonas salipaludis TaxID=2032625 RepID=A0A2A2EXP4_9GAMM|nr:C45 family peptidase [Halomonas salipaludis]PAU77155.1 peptidase C45 acyl-coenzyme A--6- aminopenicillanic acid acyl-transferase [Halomonas salipaludis]